MGSGQGDRCCSQVVHEQPVEMTLADRQSLGQSGHTHPVDFASLDESNRSADQIISDAPLW